MLVGIDIGSRTIKDVAVRDGKMEDWHVVESGFNPSAQSFDLVKRYRPRRTVSTGYGRHLAHQKFADDVITEIKAHALGARHLFPGCRTVLDVGGQDSKVIVLDGNGKVSSFQMNDKCAAGTGRFLEIMALSLGIPLADLGQTALQASRDITVNSMCAVFAESEVISLKNRGAAPADIARAVHLSVVDRLAAMLSRTGYGDNVVFTGGVARNKAVISLLQERLKTSVLVPPVPDIVGALGAALSGASTADLDSSTGHSF